MALKTYLNPRIDLVIRLGGFKAEHFENPTLLHDGWVGIRWFLDQIIQKPNILDDSGYC